MQTKRRKQAQSVRELREGGATWKEVEERTGTKPDLGRALLKELDQHEAERVPTVEEARKALQNEKPSKPTKERKASGPRSGRYLKAVCECVGTNVVRTSATVLGRGLTCGGCGSTFKEAR